MEVMQVRGQVREVEDGMALVEVKGDGCGRCHEEGGCGGHSLARALCGAPRAFRVPNTMGVLPGEEVALGVPARAVIAGASLAYTLPVLCLIGGAMLGMHFHGEAGAMLTGGGGLCLAWLFLYRKTRKGAGNPGFCPQLEPLDSHQPKRRSIP